MALRSLVTLVALIRKNMGQLLIYVPLTGYLRQWLTGRLGIPVSFPHGSYENAVIARHIARLPKGYAPQMCGRDDVPVVVPAIHGKPPEAYNYFGRRGVAELTEAIATLFTLDLWHGVAPLLTSSALNEGIDKWCAGCGITLDNREAVRQKFYRIRKAYAQHGIILGKKYKKKD